MINLKAAKVLKVGEQSRAADMIQTSEKEKVKNLKLVQLKSCHNIILALVKDSKFYTWNFSEIYQHNVINTKQKHFPFI